MSTKIRIKLPTKRRDSKENNGPRTADQVMFDRFRHMKDISEEEKDLLKEYVKVNKFRESQRSLDKEKLNEISVTSPRMNNKNGGFRPVKGYNPKFSAHKKARIDPRKVFVKNFVNKQSLEIVFQSFNVENISIKDGKNFAFVSFRDEGEVSKAVKSLNGSKKGCLPETSLFVERARQKRN